MDNSSSQDLERADKIINENNMTILPEGGYYSLNYTHEEKGKFNIGERNLLSVIYYMLKGDDR